MIKQPHKLRACRLLKKKQKIMSFSNFYNKMNDMSFGFFWLNEKTVFRFMFILNDSLFWMIKQSYKLRTCRPIKKKKKIKDMSFLLKEQEVMSFTHQRKWQCSFSLKTTSRSPGMPLLNLESFRISSRSRLRFYLEFFYLCSDRDNWGRFSTICKFHSRTCQILKTHVLFSPKIGSLWSQVQGFHQ